MNTNYSTQTAAERYGVDESNGLIDGAAYHESVSHEEYYNLARLAAEGGKISRLRILTGMWAGRKMADVSYCHGTLPSGQVVSISVNGDVMGVPLWGKNGLKSKLIEWAKEEGVYAKGLGLLDESNWSVLN